jgi:hypothetical protein
VLLEAQRRLSRLEPALPQRSQGHPFALRLPPGKAPLLTLQAAQDLPLPALLDPLDGSRRDVDRRPVLEPWAQERVDVWVSWPIVAAVLMDREDAITDGPLRGRAVQPCEAFGGVVVDRQDEAEISRSWQPARVFRERSLDRLLVAPEGLVAVADAEQLPPFATLQTLLSMRDVADLLRHRARVSVVPSLHEKHSLPPFCSVPPRRLVQLPFRLGDAPRRLRVKVSQEILAEMVGTTRPRVNYFMNKFRKLGFIEYNGGIQINEALLSVVLHE